MRSTHTHICDLILHILPPEARKAHIFQTSQQDHSSQLVSCLIIVISVTSTKSKITICYRNDVIILYGHYHRDNSICVIYSTGSIPHKTSTLYLPLNISFIATPCPQYFTMAQCISFIHGAFGLPLLSTFYDTLDRSFLVSLSYICQTSEEIPTVICSNGAASFISDTTK